MSDPYRNFAASFFDAMDDDESFSGSSYPRRTSYNSASEGFSTRRSSFSDEDIHYEFFGRLPNHIPLRDPDMESRRNMGSESYGRDEYMGPHVGSRSNSFRTSRDSPASQATGGRAQHTGRDPREHSYRPRNYSPEWPTNSDRHRRRDNDRHEQSSRSEEARYQGATTYDPHRGYYTQEYVPMGRVSRDQRRPDNADNHRQEFRRSRPRRDRSPDQRSHHEHTGARPTVHQSQSARYVYVYPQAAHQPEVRPGHRHHYTEPPRDPARPQYDASYFTPGMRAEPAGYRTEIREPRGTASGASYAQHGAAHPSHRPEPRESRGATDGAYPRQERTQEYPSYRTETREPLGSRHGQRTTRPESPPLRPREGRTRNPSPPPRSHHNRHNSHDSRYRPNQHYHEERPRPSGSTHTNSSHSHQYQNTYSSTNSSHSKSHSHPHADFPPSHRPIIENKKLYDALGIAQTATPAEIKTAYRTMALKFHPDKNPSGAEMFKKIAEAYGILSDVEKRREYDLLGYEAVTATGR